MPWITRLVPTKVTSEMVALVVGLVIVPTVMLPDPVATADPACSAHEVGKYNG